jgi:hypothetical protein
MTTEMIEKVCAAIAPGVFFSFDCHTRQQSEWAWDGHPESDRTTIREIATAALQSCNYAGLVAENARLRKELREIAEYEGEVGEYYRALNDCQPAPPFNPTQPKRSR